MLAHTIPTLYFSAQYTIYCRPSTPYKIHLATKCCAGIHQSADLCSDRSYLEIHMAGLIKVKEVVVFEPL